MASQLARKLAETNKSIVSLQEKVRKRFGDKGVKLVVAAFGVKPGETHQMDQDYFKKQIKIYIGEDGDTAVAYVPDFPEKFVQLKRQGGKWFIDVRKDQAEALPLTLGSKPEELFADRIKEVKELLGRSKTIEEFQSGLEALENPEPEKKKK